MYVYVSFMSLCVSAMVSVSICFCVGVIDCVETCLYREMPILMLVFHATSDFITIQSLLQTSNHCKTHKNP